MKTLNMYTKLTLNGGWMILTFIALILMLVVIVDRDYITRKIQAKCIGAEFYGAVKHAWKLILIFFMIIFFACCSKTNGHRVMVEATIDDTYPIGAVYDKYDIVEKRGDIWVLELRPIHEEPNPYETIEEETVEEVTE